MNDAQRAELAELRAEQQALKARLALLETRLDQFVATPAASASEPMPAAPPVPIEQPPLLPPPLPHMVARLAVAPPTSAPAPVAAPMPDGGDSRPDLKTDAAPMSPPSAPLPDEKAPRESLEMQIGTTWLARAGVVLLLTSLAFFGNYLYHHIVPHLGPLAKISLFYLAAGALTGLGAWLERSPRFRETSGMQNYARVVLAGGLAAVYYVTYIAHWNPHLRIISSAGLDGGLLLGWAAFMAWLADRRGSELLATFATLLAYYTSAINEISLFTLVSNAFLTAAAVFLLRRHLWKIFPFASLLATYGSYGFWRYFHHYTMGHALPGGDGLPPVSSLATGGFWLEGTFLLLYWALFTWVVFSAGEGVLTTRRRAGFVTANNGAFFVLGTWALLADYPDAFWKWSLALGVVWVVLAEICRRLPEPLDAETETAYLLEGLLLVTLGFINYFSGWHLALVFGVQSAFLVLAAGQRSSSALLGAGGVVGLLALAWGLHGVDHGPWIATLAEGAFLVFNAWQCQLRRDQARIADSPAAAEKPSVHARVLPSAPAFFSLLGLDLWLALIERRVTPEAALSPTLAGAAVLLTASVYLLRVRAIPFLAQFYLLDAYLHWAFTYAFPFPAQVAPPWWNPVALLVATLALGHWWRARQVKEVLRLDAIRPGVAAANAVLAVAILYLWLRPSPFASDAPWVAETAGLSLVVLAYGLVTGWRTLALAGQLLLVASSLHFFLQWDHPWQGFGSEMWLTLAPLLAVIATLAVGRRYLTTGDGASPLPNRVAAGYEAAALVLFLAWGVRYIPLEARFSFFCVAGAAVFALGCVFREKRWLVLSAAPTALGVGIFLLGYDSGERGNLLHLLGILSLASQQQFGRRSLGEAARAFFPAKAQAALMTAATFCAWILLSVRVGRWHDSAFTLAASWSLFAPLVFALGLALRERVYRWLALLILGVTLGRVLLFDIWTLDFLGQAITFFCLGAVVLALGFIYNRYQARFREIF